MSTVRATDTIAAPPGFILTAVFEQTCGACGCVFRVEVSRARVQADIQEYSCPVCHDHVCRVHTSEPPRLTVLSQRAVRGKSA